MNNGGVVFRSRLAIVVFVAWLAAIGGVEMYQTNKLSQIDTIIEPLCVTPDFKDACRAALIEADPGNVGDLCRLTAEILRDHGEGARCVIRP